MGFQLDAGAREDRAEVRSGVVQYFGPYGDPPVIRGLAVPRPLFGEHVPVPSGRFCAHCDSLISELDYGFILPFLGSPTEEKTAVYHRRCLAEALGVKGRF